MILPSSTDPEKDMSMQMPYQECHANPVNISKINPVLIQIYDAEQEVSLPVEGSTDYECVQLKAVTRTQDAEAFIQGPVLLDGLDHSDIQQSQTEDADTGPILLLLEENKSKPDWSTISGKTTAFKTLWRNWDRLRTSMLYQRWSHEDTDILQLVVPKLKRTEVIEMHHSIPSAAHLDAKRTMEHIKRRKTLLTL